MNILDEEQQNGVDLLATQPSVEATILNVGVEARARNILLLKCDDKKLNTQNGSASVVLVSLFL